MKRNSVSEYIDMKHGTPTPVRSYTHFGLPPPPPTFSPVSCNLRMYLIDGPFLNQINI